MAIIVEQASVIPDVPGAKDLELTGNSGLDPVIRLRLATHFPAQDRPIAIIRHLQGKL